MAKVTSINVLLDMRQINNYEQGLKCAVLSVKKDLELAKGINVKYLVNHGSGDVELEEERMMYDDSSFAMIDVYISAEKCVPEAIRKTIEITRYGIVDGVLLNFHGNVNAGWYEDTVKAYQDSYDYFVTFSEKTRSMVMNVDKGIGEDRVVCIPLNEFNNDDKCVRKDSLEMNKDSYVTFYKKEYLREAEIAAKAFLRMLKEGENKEAVFVLACLDNETPVNEVIVDLFAKNQENLRIVSVSNKEDKEKLMEEASFFIDIFWLEDINALLFDELKYNAIIISNSLAVEHEKIINVHNSILDFQGALEKARTLNCGLDEDATGNSVNDNVLFDTLVRNENIKREEPLVTVVTITFNLLNAGRKETIQQCIESVHNQSYKNVEHIIIDGASTDGTLELLKPYEQKGWIEIYSEKDTGLYDAMNKGIRRANGKYIAFLNSDDFYHDMYGLQKTVCTLQKTQSDYTFSDTNILNEDGSIYYWIADIGNMLYARNYCHQSMFVRTDVMRELGGFDLNYRVSSDSDVMIRIFANGYTYAKTEHSFVTYRGGGLSATTAEESRRDHSYSFYLHLGNRYGLTSKECYSLWQYRFLDELPANLQARLISKIPSFFNSEMLLNEFMRRQTHTSEVSLKRKIAQQLPFDKLHISRRMRVKNGRNEMVYYFCRVIPIWVTKERI